MLWTVVAIVVIMWNLDSVFFDAMEEHWPRDFRSAVKAVFKIPLFGPMLAIWIFLWTEQELVRAWHWLVG